MQVSRSAYYAWLHRVPTQAEKEDAELTALIQDVVKKSRATYGGRRIKKSLLHCEDRKVSRRRISRLMRDADLACKTKRKFKATTGSRHDRPISPNHLGRQFTVGQPNQAYAGDIAYIHAQGMVIFGDRHRPVFKACRRLMWLH
ncbi:MAG: IS3 family transposase [Methyloglobulus sp.]